MLGPGARGRGGRGGTGISRPAARRGWRGRGFASAQPCVAGPAPRATWGIREVPAGFRPLGEPWCPLRRTFWVAHQGCGFESSSSGLPFTPGAQGRWWGLSSRAGTPRDYVLKGHIKKSIWRKDPWIYSCAATSRCSTASSPFVGDSHPPGCPLRLLFKTLALQHRGAPSSGKPFPDLPTPGPL